MLEESYLSSPSESSLVFQIKSPPTSVQYSAPGVFLPVTPHLLHNWLSPLCSCLASLPVHLVPITLRLSVCFFPTWECRITLPPPRKLLGPSKLLQVQLLHAVFLSHSHLVIIFVWPPTHLRMWCPHTAFKCKSLCGIAFSPIIITQVYLYPLMGQKALTSPDTKSRLHTTSLSPHYTHAWHNYRL